MNNFILIILSGFAVIGVYSTFIYFFKKTLDRTIYSDCTLNLVVKDSEAVECKLYTLLLALDDSPLSNVPIVVSKY